jgi:branched-chain amino acid transport system permease protein
MEVNLITLLITVVKILAIIAWVYGLLWVLGRSSRWVKIVGIIAAFGIIQLALTSFGESGEFQVLNDFDRGLLFQASAMMMVVLGLSLIYGFNGQFSLGQWAFYGIGAYTAADITYRWVNGDARGLLIVVIGVSLGGLMIWGVNRLLRQYKGMPVLSAFTLYLIGSVAAGAIAVMIANALNPALSPLLGTINAPGVLNSAVARQIIFFLAILLAGVFSAGVSFLFGLPVLTLGSDYFGIATLGFSIVVNTLMVNSDTILPFPEMKGGRGMVGIPQMRETAWFWVFVFLLLVIIVMRNLIQSSTGRAIMSVREDETAAKAMGIDVAGQKLWAFVIGSFFAGLGGAAYAHSTGTGFLSPGTFDFLAGFNPLIIVVFGGLGSMSGTIAASFGWIFFLEGLLRVILGQLGTDAPTWRYVLYPITLLLLMLLRPQGLLGTTEWGFLKAPFVRPRVKSETPAAAPAGK